VELHRPTRTTLKVVLYMKESHNETAHDYTYTSLN
jgi:hypothetical protein